MTEVKKKADFYWKNSPEGFKALGTVLSLTKRLEKEGISISLKGICEETRKNGTYALLMYAPCGESTTRAYRNNEIKYLLEDHKAKRYTRGSLAVA